MPLASRALAVLSLLVVAACGATTAPQPPNIVVIFADDVGWASLGSYGNTLVPTPHFDRLAAEVVRFTDAYATPQCTPSRAVLLSGQNTARHRIRHVIGWHDCPYADMTEGAFREQFSPRLAQLPHALHAGNAGIPERALHWYLPLYAFNWGATPSAVIRRGDYKLIEHFGDRFDRDGSYLESGAVELYDLRDDIGETRALSAEQADRASRLRSELREWIAEHGLELPTENSRYDPQRRFESTRDKPPWLGQC